MSKKNTKKKNKQTPGMLATTVSLILVAVLVIGLGGYKILDEVRVIELVDGLLDRNRIVAHSDNFELTGSELSVYEFQAAQVYYQQAQTEYLYYQYGLYQDSYGITTQFSSATDYAAYIVSYYRELGYLEEQAFHYAEQYLAFCEGAKAAGFALAEDDTQVDDYIQQLKEAATNAKMNFGRYIRNEFGMAIRESDIRSAMEKYFLFSNYSEKLQEDFSDGMTDEQLAEYLDSHMADFFTTDYVSYQLMNEAMKEVAETCKDVADIKTMICNYITGVHFDTLYKENITDKKEVALPEGVTKDSVKNDVMAAVRNLCMGDEADQNPFSDAIVKEHKGKDDEAFYKAGQTISKLIYEKVKTEVKNVKETSAAWTDVETTDEEAAKKLTDVQKWLFAKDNAAKTGAQWINSAEKVNEADQKTYTHTLYVVVEGMKLDENHKRHVGYLLLTDDKAAEGATEEEKAALKKADAKATEMLAELNKADKITEEVFTEAAKKFSTSTSFFYDLNAATDTPTVVSEWLFNADRKAGDTAILSKDSDRYVVFYDYEWEDSNWEATARENLTSEKMNAWLEEAIEKYHVHIEHTHEEAETTSTAAETTAAAEDTTAA